jgi:hypothetical protein
MSYELETRLVYLDGKKGYVPVHTVKHCNESGSTILADDLLSREDAEHLIKQHVKAKSSAVHYGITRYDDDGDLLSTWRTK